MKFIFILLTTLFVLNLQAQDNFAGSWEMKKKGIQIKLEIASPENNIAYPAQIGIQSDSFSGIYQLLLARKNYRELAISKNKFPEKEMPFSVGNATHYLTGILDFQKDLKGNSLLFLHRMNFKKSIALSETLKNIPPEHQLLFAKVLSILQTDSITLQKTNNEIPTHFNTYSIIQPGLSPVYFGITDTLITKYKSGSVRFMSNKDNDLISLKLNSLSLADQIDSKKKREDEDFLLDTGINLISFFADDFGSKDDCSASVKILFENGGSKIDFGTPENMGSIFILKRIRYEEEGKNNWEIPAYLHKTIDWNKDDKQEPKKSDKPDIALSRNGKVIGELLTRSSELTFAIWDDAVEDGDSISLSINNEWIAKGFSVKKKPQFIIVPLKPGPNVFTFVADNLGRISPNTSVLEIIDGNKRKSFFIETDMDKNNQVRIFYDVR